MSKDVLQEGPCAAALALQPAQGVGDGYDDGVDFTRGNLLLQLLDSQLCLGVFSCDLIGHLVSVTSIWVLDVMRALRRDVLESGFQLLSSASAAASCANSSSGAPATIRWRL
jgi:hypothetical protein